MGCRMPAESSDLVRAMRLLDQAKLGGFEFRRIPPGEDGPLVGHRVSGSWVDLIPILRDSAATASPGASAHHR
jgi:hypothetical protein